MKRYIDIEMIKNKSLRGIKRGTKVSFSAILILILLNLTLSYSQVYSQGSHQSTSGDINSAIELYNMGAYKNALTEFNKLIKQNSTKNGKNNALLEKAEGYKVLCSIALNQNNIASIVNTYQKKYPTSSLLAKVKYSYGNYLIENKKYSQALTAYKSVNTKQLNDQERNTLKLNNAYALLKTDKTEQAAAIFDEIINDPKSSISNISAAKYYKGYSEYSRGNFANAIKFFQESAKDVRFNELSQYYILDSKFMLKDYNYVIEKGGKIVDEKVKELYIDEQIAQIEFDDNESVETQNESTINSANREAVGKMARLVAESNYQKNNLKEANKYFNIYTKYITQMSREDRLFGGILAYNTEDYKAAVENLSKVCDIDDSLTQNASYRLAESYIKLKNKEEALKAFEKAAELEYDATIEEDAAFNYAKLRFDLTGEVESLNEYLERYKTSQKKREEIYSYIASNAILNRDYDYALEALDNIKNKSASDLLTFQKANFLKGEKLLSAGSHHLARRYLKNGAAGSNRNIANLSQLLLSECDYRDENYTQSLNTLAKLQTDSDFSKTKEFAMLHYNIGYNYFKLRRFQEAEKSFEEYITLTNSGQNNSNPTAEEAKLRIADCRFLQKDYAVAIKMYKRISASSTSSENEKDLYPDMQQAMAYGLMGNYPDKIAILRHITAAEYKYNKRYSEALYELSKAQVQNKDDGPAITTLIKLVYNPPDSLYYTQAMLDIALINANRESYDQSIQYCKKVLEYSPNSKEGEVALSTLENLYSQIGKPEEYYTYVQEKDLLRAKTPQEQEHYTFSAAEQIYLIGKYEAAISALQNYLKQFDQGENNTKAIYYIAESYKKLNNLKKSAAYYDMVIVSGNSPYLESAIRSYADICYANQQYLEAIENYEKLELVSKLTSNKIAALSGLTRSYYYNKMFEEAISKSNQLYVESINNKLVKEKEEALYYKAKSLIAEGYIDDAESILQMISNNPNSEFGAEANYLLIQKAYNRGNFKEVEKMVFDFSDTKTDQRYWLAKSFVTLGDAYAAQGSNKQALATYTSIVENYEGNDEIVDRVKEKIARLK